jgi:two-component system CheB/CheR fusion protein
LLVLVWNHKAEDLWGLRADEVQGKHFLNLDIGLPVAQLRQPVWDCLAGVKPALELDVAAVNRRGRSFPCHVVCTPLAGPGDEIRGVIMLMEEQEERGPGAAEERRS